MAKIKLTKNEQKAQKDALKMYQRYLPTLTLKKQQLQTEIRTIDAKAKAVREQRKQLEKEFQVWIAVFGEEDFTFAIIDKFLQVQSDRLGIAVIMHRIGHTEAHLFAHTKVMLGTQLGIQDDGGIVQWVDMLLPKLPRR